MRKPGELTTTTTKPDGADLDAAYSACASMTRAASTNFYYAFLTLPHDKRRAIYATYAFCRLCDDIVDEPERRAGAAVELQEAKESLRSAYDGNPSGHIWTALADARERFGIDREHFAAVIEGCEMDLTKTRYETFDELVEYCKRVASAVGLVCIEVCGYDDPRAVGYAVELGIAMQLTNVIRDVAEDAENGRIYLPQEDLEKFGYTEADLMGQVVNDNLRSLIKFEVDRARTYFDRGRRLFPLLDRRSRACPQAMAEVYVSLLDHVVAADYDVISQRVSLSGRAKLAMVAKLWLRSRIPLFR
jgi:phytoene synthase